MLREASISDLKRHGIPKERRVLVNRGRGNDELAPADSLYGDFDARKRELESILGKGSAEAHNAAYLEIDYERRFRDQVANDSAALATLEDIARHASAEEIFLVCYEGLAKACHRRILLRLAEERWGAEVLVEGIEPT